MVPGRGTESREVGQPLEAAERGAGTLPVGLALDEAAKSIAVPLSDGAAARMERPFRDGPAQEPQRGRKLKAVQVRGSAALQRRDLAQGMNTRIRPRCAVDDRSLSQETTQPGLQGPLDRRHSRVLLPAAKRRAVVREEQREGLVQDNTRC